MRRKYLHELHLHTERQTILYASGWLQKEDAASTSIGEEDIHALMEVTAGMSGRELDLILHSPGGSVDAAESIVSYLRSRFSHIRVIIPHLAMSAATMIACAADEIMMGKHSFLGPTDPQFLLTTPLGVRSVPAQAVLDQFEKAKRECADPAKLSAWLPMLAQYGPSSCGKSGSPHGRRVRSALNDMPLRKKLIEVALPLDAINQASAREKSIRHGHPSTLHLWWARRPLAAARAVIFAQMVDDPASWPEEFPTEAAQEAERQRLFRLIEQLVLWENTTNEELLEQARNEIRRSWRRTCAEHRDHPQAAELFDPERLPAFHDPFAGGGSLPLEAHASDLNPVAVLINKAMIEIPPKFAGMPPVNPEARAQMAKDRELGMEREWKGAQGWPRTCATTAGGCATKRGDASGIQRREWLHLAAAPVPLREGGGIDTERVTAITIVDVVDYH